MYKGVTLATHQSQNRIESVDANLKSLKSSENDMMLEAPLTLKKTCMPVDHTVFAEDGLLPYNIRSQNTLLKVQKWLKNSSVYDRENV